MKALILAAGLGTRLLPHTKSLPKPLFTIRGRPMIDIVIGKLIDAKCEKIMVNTHHLHRRMESYLSAQKYPIPVETVYEPEILGTGGAIKNLSRFWDDRPFWVVNADVLTDIDLKLLMKRHLGHEYPVSMCLTDADGFNTVSCDSQGFVIGFESNEAFGEGREKKFTFTGIQVIDPLVLDFIPSNRFYSSIDAYREMLAAGHKLKAEFFTDAYWKDTGTPERYREAVLDQMIPAALERAFPGGRVENVELEPLSGDGSDRKWYRLICDQGRLILADHGIDVSRKTTEAKSFVAIGKHLSEKGVPVPRIYLSDPLPGMVFMEDLGDTHLQDFALSQGTGRETMSLYEKAIRALCEMSVKGGQGFDPAWTFQGNHYDRELILEKECRYFSEAFVRDYAGGEDPFEKLGGEFSFLADQIGKFGVTGFMHRDFQSRNIMVKRDRPVFIDFQGGRLGPIQYDLASLLIDPYVGLGSREQSDLLQFCIRQLQTLCPICPEKFLNGYRFCAISRNLQILGAFAFLSRVKRKTAFEKYIPRALSRLKTNLETFFPEDFFPDLKKVLDRL